jgi:hypothetical protein
MPKKSISLECKNKPEPSIEKLMAEFEMLDSEAQEVVYQLILLLTHGRTDNPISRPVRPKTTH